MCWNALKCGSVTCLSKSLANASAHTPPLMNETPTRNNFKAIYAPDGRKSTGSTVQPIGWRRLC